MCHLDVTQTDLGLEFNNVAGFKIFVRSFHTVFPHRL